MKSTARMKMTWLLLLLVSSVTAKPKAKGKADPEAWDWQHEPATFPVFSPFPATKLDQPEFMRINRNISVVVGETAFLPCRVKKLDTYTVSWLRAADVTVLSVGHLAFSSDKRISVVQVPRPRLSASDWNLSIEGATLEDDGLYECQVNTEPKINYKVFLRVTDPAKSPQADSPYYDVVEHVPGGGFEQTHSVMKKHHQGVEKSGFSMYLHQNGCICPKPEFAKHKQAESHRKENKGKDLTMSIPGGSIQYVTGGEGVMLECLLSGLSSAPASLYWEKGGQVVSPRDRLGVALETEKVAGVSKTSLYLGSTSQADTGNYTCVSETQTKTVLLVVMPDTDKKEASARVAGGGGEISLPSTAVLCTLVIMSTM
jgi:hypothetical protein